MTATLVAATDLGDGRSEIFDCLHSLEAIAKLKKMYVIVGDAAMQLYGLKLADNIDLVLEPGLYQKLDSQATDSRFKPGWRPLKDRTRSRLISDGLGPFHYSDNGNGETRGDINFISPPEDDPLHLSYKDLHLQARMMEGFSVAAPYNLLFAKQVIVEHLKTESDSIQPLSVDGVQANVLEHKLWVQKEAIAANLAAHQQDIELLEGLMAEESSRS